MKRINFLALFGLAELFPNTFTAQAKLYANLSLQPPLMQGRYSYANNYDKPAVESYYSSANRRFVCLQMAKVNQHSFARQVEHL